ncbi:ABC transporter permease [Actinoplanes philippinensis]|uniref:Peptide/nickel transport system permease protein n=1 Tax=Actinoplanes philippinensis TaxID=35752 RepID=A0A1I2HDQ5_9ACTN|nr:ABC transporter permease [Actinoplanes philippinensis]GIE81729.1 ABC transporter permease [Actinoplanes philippinensis]SFF28314.1 peptide/nickel transport system permease protein [Actinoplanes philippinensis]
MIRLIRRRLAVAVPVLFATSVGMFVLGAASPNDPAAQYAGAAAFTASPENLAQIRANWGVDDPLPVQYLRWLGNLAQGDLGWSTSRHQAVAEVIGARAGWTLLLIGVTLLVVLAGSLLVGTIAAYRRGGLFDRGVRAAAYAVESMPVFWLALAAIAVFALGLGWFPAGGLTDVRATGTGVGDVAHHLVLPVAVLAISQAPWFLLFVRDSVADSLRDDHVLAARARGLPGRTVLFGHALRTALLPYLTLIGTHLPELVGGSVLVETVFSLPGLGAVSVQAALGSDFPLLAAITLITTAVVLAANLVTDLAYSAADPRVRVDG